jgi:ATP-dependent helicase/nuclease subunit B
LLELESELLKALEAGTVVVPSAQRANALQLGYGVAQLTLGRKLWRSPQVCSYTAWLERTAVCPNGYGTPAQRVLRGAEEWLLWREVARDAAEIQHVDFDQALAESLRRSAQTLHDWRISKQALEHISTDESRLLARVLRRFDARCADAHATASFQLAERLLSGRSKRPATFAGFVAPTAAQIELLKGGFAKSMRDDRVEGHAFMVGAADSSDECRLVAEWCRDHLTEDPARRLLVIAPDLHRSRPMLHRALEHALSPDVTLGCGGHDGRVSIAIEGGQPLARFPLVHHALDTLRLLTGELEFSAFSGWLRAPFWKALSDSERTRLDLWLRNWLRPEVRAEDLREPLAMVPTSMRPSALQLQQAIDGGLRALGERPVGASQWPRRFTAALTALDWPGARSLDSAEHQTRSRFLELLDELAALGSTAGTMSALEAVNTLQALAMRVAFEPATGDASVTITEALGDPIVRYDGIWVLGLHAEAWPRPVRIDPFIPLAAQREAGVPASSANGQLRQAQAFLEVWRRSAAQLVMSWSRRSEDGEHLPSALIQKMADVERWEAPDRRVSLHRLTRQGEILETYTDTKGTPWSPAIVLPSGTRSLDYQNLCPFRAYAELRLHCIPLESPRPGVDLRDRGRLLHRALEYLWTRLETSEGLRACRDEARKTLIEDCVSRATHDCFDESALKQAPRAIARELRRAERLIAQLCELEEQRAPFRVRALEARRALRIASASLEVRIDRMDELADGTLVIFDYKTGQPRPQDWLEQRPANPQLLVYLRAAQTRVAALATVHLTAARVLYRGIADRADRLPKVEGLQDAWPRQLESWHGYVERLVTDFLAGHAVLDPLGDACRLCHLHAFCRVADADLNNEGVEQDG